MMSSTPCLLFSSVLLVLVLSCSLPVQSVRIQHLTRVTRTAAAATNQRTDAEVQAITQLMNELEQHTDADAEAEAEAGAEAGAGADAGTEVETEVDTETEAQAEAEAEAEKKKYEAIEHQYAGIGVMKKRGAGTSRWMNDENGIGGSIIMPKDDINEGSFDDTREVTTEPLYDEVREASGTKMWRWTYSSIVPIFGDYIAPQRDGTIICKPKSAAERRAMFDYHFNDLWTIKDKDSYITKLTDQLVAREHLMVKRSYKKNVEELPDNLKSYPAKSNDLKKFATEYGIDALFRKAWNEQADNKFAQDETLKTLPKEFETSLGEAMMLNNNDDHFIASNCAENAYIAGHTSALEAAYRAGFDWTLAVELKNIAKANQKGMTATKFGKTNLYDYAITVSNDRQRNARGLLRKAYAMDAAANHFLTDMFSAGHIRTPRPEMHAVCNTIVGGFAGLTSNVMHDEDNLNGLLVTNKKGELWWAFGDKRYFDDLNAMNRAQIGRAVESSRTEVWQSFTDGNYGGLQWLDSVNAKASKTVTAPRVTSGRVVDTGVLGSGSGFFSLFSSPKFPDSVTKKLAVDATPRQQFEKITAYLSLRDDADYLTILRVDASKFGALDYIPRPEFAVGMAGGLDVRMALENTCPRYRLKPGTDNTWQIRTGRATTSGNSRPAIAAVLKVPSTREKYASAELFPTFKSLTKEDFKIPSEVMSSIDKNAEYSTECEYEDMTSDHCCVLYATEGELGNRFPPQLESPQSGFVPTYQGECKNVGSYGNKHPSAFSGNKVSPRKVPDFLAQTTFKYA